MASIDRRIQDLERRLASLQSAEPGGSSGLSEAYANLRAVLRELTTLKASCADRWTGERNRIRVEGANIPRQVLGPGYTHGGLIRLAVERASEAGAFPEEEIPRWTAAMFEFSGRENHRDEVVEWERVHGV